MVASSHQTSDVTVQRFPRATISKYRKRTQLPVLPNWCNIHACILATVVTEPNEKGYRPSYSTRSQSLYKGSQMCLRARWPVHSVPCHILPFFFMFPATCKSCAMTCGPCKRPAIKTVEQRCAPITEKALVLVALLVGALCWATTSTIRAPDIS